MPSLAFIQWSSFKISLISPLSLVFLTLSQLQQIFTQLSRETGIILPFIQKTSPLRLGMNRNNGILLCVEPIWNITDLDYVTCARSCMYACVCVCACMCVRVHVCVSGSYQSVVCNVGVLGEGDVCDGV